MFSPADLRVTGFIILRSERRRGEVNLPINNVCHSGGRRLEHRLDTGADVNYQNRRLFPVVTLDIFSTMLFHFFVYAADRDSNSPVPTAQR